jgi:succinate dehydrogenase flavin-adding protein (antitoxin of CptAB toxin-antitoxin module)
MSDAAGLEIRRRLLFRAGHRGTQETDILLGTFGTMTDDSPFHLQLDQLRRDGPFTLRTPIPAA